MEGFKTAVECRYRGRVIGWLVEGRAGFLKYIQAETTTFQNGTRFVWKPWGLK
jgi:hypothetical protein